VFDHLTFHEVAGTDRRQRVRMLALSTCGFCRRGQEFLERRGVAYEWIHLDTLDPETKSALKQQFKERFGVTLSYPALVIDDARHTIGYVKHQWEELLTLPHDEPSVGVGPDDEAH
jgi:glutaredoxin-like protein NrdH